jgi:hypothetical protein
VPHDNIELSAQMSIASFLLMIAILLAAAIQYGLAVFAVRDLMRRERLRGANKVTWSLIILCIPFLGPLLYATVATDGLPNPRPSPASTWPGRRWRVVRTLGQWSGSFLRGAEVPKEPDPWDELPVSHDAVISAERPVRERPDHRG